MRHALALVAVLTLVAGGRAMGQSSVFGASAQGFTFADPSAVGLRSYTMVATTLGVSVPIRPWLAAGTVVQMASASLSSWGVESVAVSGLTDTDLFLRALAGPLQVKAGYALPVGNSTVSSEENVVAALAAHEFLPLPVRSWGRGGGYTLEAVLPVRSAGADWEFLASLRSHAGFQAFEDDPFEYRLGAEWRFGIKAGYAPTALSHVEAGGLFVKPRPDRALGTTVFEAGHRLAFFSVLGFPVGRTSVLARADLFFRGAGSDTGRPSAGEDLLGGAVSPGPRELVAAAIETRTPLRRAPLLLAARGRYVRDDAGRGRSWLVSGEVGTDLEVQGPWPGRLFLTPAAALHRGRVRVDDGYESAAAAWEVTLGARWEAGR